MDYGKMSGMGGDPSGEVSMKLDKLKELKNKRLELLKKELKIINNETELETLILFCKKLYEKGYYSFIWFNADILGIFTGRRIS